MPEPAPTFPLPSNHFDGAGKITDGKLAAALNALAAGGFGSWTSIVSLLTGWEIASFADGTPGNVFPLQYRVNGAGDVQFRGTIQKKATATASLFDLPAAIAPPTDLALVGIVQSVAVGKGEAGNLGISTSGTPKFVLSHPVFGVMNNDDLIFFDGVVYSITPL